MAARDIALPFKKCQCCHLFFPRNDDYFSIKDKKGHLGYCERCKQKNDKASYDKRRKKILEQKTEYYVRNKEKLNAKSNAYAKTENGKKSRKKTYIKYREDRLDRSREYHRDHKEENNAKSRKYRHSHKDQISKKKQSLEHRIKRRVNAKRLYSSKKHEFIQRAHKRRANKLGKAWLFPEEHERFCRSFWGNTCAYCGKIEDIWLFIAMDHFIPLASDDSPGTVITNMLPACHAKKDCPYDIVACNNAKSAKDPIKWLVQKLGPRKAKAKLKEIAAFFEAARAFGESQKQAS